MKIGINGLTLSDQNSGIGIYTLNLINTLADISNYEYILFSSCQDKIENLINKKIKIINIPIASKNKYTRLFTEQIYLPYYVLKEKIDLMLSPAFTMPLLSPCKNIVTVHDMSYKIYAQGSALYARIYMRLFFDSSIKRADHIITVSEATKTDLLKYFPDRKNVSAIHLGTIKFDQNVKQKPDVIQAKDNFLLVVGTITPRKNTMGIIKAFNKIKNQTNYKLVFAGGFAWKSQEIFDYIKNNNLSDKIKITGYLRDEELSWCYENADALLYCSFYEGFGLPPLEAMQAGTPVIASNISSIPEVVGDAALLIDPYNIDEIADSILTLYNDRVKRQSLIDSGAKRYKKFTWETTAIKTLKVINQTME